MNIRTVRLSATAIFALGMIATGFAAAPAEDPETPMSAELISRADATQLAQAALQACAARGMPASVIVTDSAGHMRAAFSDDNAKLIGIGTSGTKANSVRDFKASTHALQARAQSDQAFARKYDKDARYHFSPGGLPIYRNDRFVAIIAVGGARNIDEECALAALKTLSWASTEPSDNAPPAAAPAEPRTFISATEIAERIAKADAAAKAGTQYNGGPLLLQAPFRANMEYRNTPATVVNSHDNDAELFVVVEGAGTMTLGGTLVNPTRNGANLQAATVEGGVPYKLVKGDMILVPVNTAHAVTAVEGKLALMSLHLPLPAAATAPTAAPAPAR